MWSPFALFLKTLEGNVIIFSSWMGKKSEVVGENARGKKREYAQKSKGLCFSNSRVNMRSILAVSAGNMKVAGGERKRHEMRKCG